MITAMTGITLTAVVQKATQKKESLTIRQRALILAVCIFITWLCSFFAPFMTPGLIRNLNKGFLLFGLAHSVVVGVIAYFAELFFLKMKRKV
jgi:uncharacterized membrane protein (DUF485 family)